MLPNTLVSISQFRKSPSSNDLDYELEWKIRAKSCLLIQRSAIILKLKQSTSATAQILFQRFYYVKSLIRYDPFQISLGCLFLACKIEENQISTRDLIKVFDYVIQFDESLKLDEKEMEKIHDKFKICKTL